MGSYETAFETVAGDLKSTIPVEKIPHFVDALFPEYPYRGASPVLSRLHMLLICVSHVIERSDSYSYSYSYSYSLQT